MTHLFKGLVRVLTATTAALLVASSITLSVTPAIMTLNTGNVDWMWWYLTPLLVVAWFVGSDIPEVDDDYDE